MIRSFLQQDYKLSGEHIQEFAFAINNSVDDSSKVNPFFLNYGRNFVPLFLKNENLPRPVSSTIDWSDYISRLEAYNDLVKRFTLNVGSNR